MKFFLICALLVIVNAHAASETVFDCMEDVGTKKYRYHLEIIDGQSFSLYHSVIDNNETIATTLFAQDMHCEQNLGIDCDYAGVLFLKFYPVAKYDNHGEVIEREHSLRFGWTNNINSPEKDVIQAHFKAGSCNLY